MIRHVLLTGAGGFVGHHVLEHLLINTDWQLTLTDSFRHHGITERISQVLKTHPEHASRVRVITHDLSVPWSPIGIRDISFLGPVDAIINIASESHVDRSIVEPVPFIRNNVDIILNMLELARTLGCKFLHLSTDEVFGAMPLGRPSLEWDPILPSNPYSASKAAQEAICCSYWRTYSIPLVMLNSMNIIGERQHPEKFIPMTIRKVLAGDPMTIHVAPDGEIGTRHYLHARNLADAMLFILNSTSPVLYPASEFPDRYNVAGTHPISNLEMAKAIAKFAGKELKYELVNFHSSRPGHDLHYGLDASKIAGIGWEMPVPLMESLEKTVHWTMEHPQWLNLGDK